MPKRVGNVLVSRARSVNYGSPLSLAGGAGSGSGHESSLGLAQHETTLSQCEPNSSADNDHPYPEFDDFFNDNTVVEPKSSPDLNLNSRKHDAIAMAIATYPENVRGFYLRL